VTKKVEQSGELSPCSSTHEKGEVQDGPELRPRTAVAVTTPDDPLFSELRAFADTERSDLARLEGLLSRLRQSSAAAEAELDIDAIWLRVETALQLPVSDQAEEDPPTT
jgi:hypothetical protein